MSEPRIDVLSDIACHLGEGPTYDPASQTLFWFDILGRKLWSRSDAGEVSVTDLPEMTSALGVIDAGRQLLVTETGLHVRDVATGRITLHTPLEADNAGTRSNDSRVHPCGAFWIGTMGKHAEKQAGAIYWFSRGEVRRIVPDVTIPNSICFSPDGSVAYYTDTTSGMLHRIDCDPATGLPRGQAKIFHDQRGQPGSIDGSVIDADGVLWNALWGAGRVDAYTPDRKRIRSIDLPAKQTSCPAFYGPNADRLAVTSAYEGYDDASHAADPKAGWTFAIDMPVKGRFEPRVLI
ncbi:MAG: SMP-30/gluconolactonase/LRE family protein [Rhizobiaceae bacterium]